eukprot:6989857-Prymnesium_polylepis.1
MRNRWAKLHGVGEKVAEMLARLAAIDDKNTHDCWARLGSSAATRRCCNVHGARLWRLRRGG